MQLHHERIAIFTVGHLLGFYGVIKTFQYSSPFLLWLELWFWWSFCGLGITAGAHRLWSHRSYKARAPLKWFLMILNSMCHQGHLIYWCRDHRTHHKFSDTDGDPHSSKYGFFYAHMGWLLYTKPSEVRAAGNKISVEDLKADEVVLFQYNLYPWWNLFWCFAVPTLYGGWRLGTYLDGFIVFGVLRWLLTLHATWCVNSVAHFFGYRPYSDIPPAESLVTSLLTAGEGWHNYHHTHPYDYATSEFGFSRLQWNPTKSFIDLMYYLGLAYDLKRAKKVRKRNVCNEAII